MAKLDRWRFVPEALGEEAGTDTALPIGCGQTISQPYVVAYMTQALEVKRGMRVLEVGTGSGYQAAVLLEMGAEVYSVEWVPELAEQARALLEGLGYGAPRLHLRCGDGREGWPEAAPFGGIVVTAAAETVPPALLSQLGLKGRLIAPVGTEDQQQLVLLRRDEEGLTSEWLLPVRFVPLLG
jgi:protein-L-isoaspartate(D-aspartate) O-methyltransferase